jgi:hypothetical protein
MEEKTSPINKTAQQANRETKDPLTPNGEKSAKHEKDFADFSRRTQNLCNMMIPLLGHE